ncbi:MULTISPECIES: hypothetical protein [Enterobacter cloacae complex]|uniref:hypothetical protein n=1 Tax=Enterobacter cloacae complex TaxID=354276 RepID=UPI0030183552
MVMLQAIELKKIVAGLKRFGHCRLFHREIFEDDQKVHQIITLDERVVAFWNASKKQWVCNNQTALINPCLPSTDPTNVTELTVEWIEQVTFIL